MRYLESLLVRKGVDSDRLEYALCCLSRNPTLKLVSISFSSSLSQIIRGTGLLSLASISSLEEEEDEEEEGDEKNDKTGGEVLAF